MKTCFTPLKEIKIKKITYQFLPQIIAWVGTWRVWYFHTLATCYKLVPHLFRYQLGM